MKKLVAFSLLGLCCLVLAPQAWAESVKRQLPFTKKVTLVVPKTYLFKFDLCTDSVCTGIAYAETQKIVLKTATLSFNLGAGTLDPTSPAFEEVDFSQQYWLRISRSSATGFVPIGPPSKLNVVPYALWSNQVEGGAGIGTITGVVAGNGLSGGDMTGIATLNVGAGTGISVGADTVSIASGGVTSALIADGSVSSADIADGAVTGVDIADGSIGSADIADGTVSGTDIADGTVGSADVANSSITSADVDSGTVQLRVSGTCPAGQYMRGINANGTVLCAAGLLVDTRIGNSGAVPRAAGFLTILDNYVPSMNVKAFVFARCSVDGTASGQTFNMRAAVRNEGTAAVTVGNAFYLTTYMPGANLSEFNTVYDTFDLAGGTTYDVGVNAANFSPDGAGVDDCSVMVQLFSR